MIPNQGKAVHRALPSCQGQPRLLETKISCRLLLNCGKPSTHRRSKEPLKNTRGGYDEYREKQMEP